MIPPSHRKHKTSLYRFSLLLCWHLLLLSSLWSSGRTGEGLPGVVPYQDGAGDERSRDCGLYLYISSAVPYRVNLDDGHVPETPSPLHPSPPSAESLNIEVQQQTIPARTPCRQTGRPLEAVSAVSYTARYHLPVATVPPAVFLISMRFAPCSSSALRRNSFWRLETRHFLK